MFDKVRIPLLAVLISGAFPVHAETVGEMIDLSNEKALLDLKVQVQEKRNKLKELQTDKPASSAAVAAPAGMPPLPQPGMSALSGLPPVPAAEDEISVVSVSGLDDDLYADISYRGVTTTVSSRNRATMVIGGWKIEKIDRTQVAFVKGTGKKVQRKVVYLSSPPQSQDGASLQTGMTSPSTAMPRF